MTTVVYKNGILAADSLVCYQGKRFGLANKVFEVKASTITKNDVVFSGSGCLMHYKLFSDFLRGDSIDKELFKSISEEGFDGIVIDKKTKEVFIYDQFLCPETVSAEFYCLGSGGDIAKGAMLMGATPKEAIECASRFDLHTNDNIQQIKL